MPSNGRWDLIRRLKVKMMMMMMMMHLNMQECNKERKLLRINIVHMLVNEGKNL